MGLRDNSDGAYGHPQMPDPASRQQYRQTVPVQEEMAEVGVDVPPSYEASQFAKAHHPNRPSGVTDVPVVEANRGPATILRRPTNNRTGNSRTSRDRPRRSDATGVSSTFSASTVDTIGYQSTHAMVWEQKETDGHWDKHAREPGCCGSTSGGCCFSTRGGCFFSDREGCCFSDREGCCFSDRGGCCFGDTEGCCCARDESCCCSPGSEEGA